MSNAPHVDWDQLDTTLRQRYAHDLEVLGPDHLPLSLHEKSLDWLDPDGCRTDPYGIFSKEVNRLELSINLFENLFMLEDKRFEMHGKEDFPIDVPREYFRFPANNHSGGPFSRATDMGPEEAGKIEKVILESKEDMNLRNDGHIVREQFHRLEFLSLFGSFEVFLQEIYAICLGGTEGDRVKANGFVMHNALPDVVKEVGKTINPATIDLLLAINPEMIEFLHYCYLARNAHTHSLGKVTGHMIKQGQKYGSLKEEDLRAVDGTLVRTEIRTTCRVAFSEPDIVEKGKYIKLAVIVAMFRCYAHEIALIFDRSMPGI